MRYLIFSDIHDNEAAFHRILQEAERRGIDRCLCLGDVGRTAALLKQVQAQEISCTFGNWEVSLLQHLGSELQAWVGSWPGVIQEGDAVFCHATPDMPSEASTTRDAYLYMQRTGVRWRQIFPFLDQDDEARWSALAALEQRSARVAFHGHTHVQLAWAWQPDAAGHMKLRPVKRRRMELLAGTEDAPSRYLIGVGSIGQPEDGPTPRYVLYDDVAGTVELCGLG
jgi:predicted phosphodiesterase